MVTSVKAFIHIFRGTARTKAIMKHECTNTLQHNFRNSLLYQQIVSQVRVHSNKISMFSTPNQQKFLPFRWSLRQYCKIQFQTWDHFRQHMKRQQRQNVLILQKVCEKPDFIIFIYLYNIMNQFSEEQRTSILKCFTQFDKDNDGRLTRDEVSILFKEMNCVSNQEEIDKLISEIDSDGNGMIQPSEFLSLMAKMMLTITSQEDMITSFKILDAHHHGAITFQSLKEILTQMGQTKMTDDDIRNMIEEADLDNDGKVTFEEFKKLLMR